MGVHVALCEGARLMGWPAACALITGIIMTGLAGLALLISRDNKRRDQDDA